MIKCIYVDAEGESRASIGQMINKIKDMRLVKSYATLDEAFEVCNKSKVDILFVRLYLLPLPEIRKTWLKKITETGTKIIVVSARITLIDDAYALHAEDFVLLPTSSRRLWKAVMKALKIKDFGIDNSYPELNDHHQLHVELKETRNKK